MVADSPRRRLQRDYLKATDKTSQETKRGLILHCDLTTQKLHSSLYESIYYLSGLPSSRTSTLRLYSNNLNFPEVVLNTLVIVVIVVVVVENCFKSKL